MQNSNESSVHSNAVVQNSENINHPYGDETFEVPYIVHKIAWATGGYKSQQNSGGNLIH